MTTKSEFKSARAHVRALIPEAHARDLAQVPFVEMAQGRLQGVTSSKSDVRRVYVSFFQKDSHDFYCSTNNNRPCGGLRGGPCKHLLILLDEAVKQYGAEGVIRYLGLDVDPDSIAKGSDLRPHLKGSQEKEPAATVFSRFLSYLRQLERAGSNAPILEMDWFILSGGEE
jgi:hypothetical protein